MDNFMI